MNKEWHRSHPMPARTSLQAATREQRIAWHAAHAVACACRDIPPSIRPDVAKLLKRRRKP
jgi:hypothetical protein